MVVLFPSFGGSERASGFSAFKDTSKRKLRDLAMGYIFTPFHFSNKVNCIKIFFDNRLENEFIASFLKSYGNL